MHYRVLLLHAVRSFEDQIVDPWYLVAERDGELVADRIRVEGEIVGRAQVDSFYFVGLEAVIHIGQP